MNTLPSSNWNPWNWFRNEETQMKQPRSNQLSGFSGTGISPFSYFGPLSSFYRDMDMMFENAFGPFGFSPSSFQKMANAFRLNVNISTTEKEYTITAEAPGISEKDLKLDLLHDHTLRIRGEKKQEADGKNRNVQNLESTYGFFERTLALPNDVDQENVSAACEHGILTITLPRKESTKSQSRSIPVNAGSSGAHASGERYSGSSAERSDTIRSSSSGNTPRKAA